MSEIKNCRSKPNTESNIKKKGSQQKKNDSKMWQLSRQNISRQFLSRYFFETEYFRLNKKTGPTQIEPRTFDVPSQAF